MSVKRAASSCIGKARMAIPLARAPFWLVRRLAMMFPAISDFRKMVTQIGLHWLLTDWLPVANGEQSKGQTA
jgi:hypothetical protein